MICNLPSEVIGSLDKGYFGYVGTSGMNGLPRVTPVIFVYEGGSIFFITSKVAKKLNNIRENPRVAFLVDVRDPSDLCNNRAVMIYGKAKVYDMLDVIFRYARVYRAVRLFAKKYPKYLDAYRKDGYKLPKAWQPTLFVRRLIVEIKIERFVYMREAQVVKVSQRS